MTVWIGTTRSRLAQLVDLCTALTTFAATFLLWEELYLYVGGHLPAPNLGDREIYYILAGISVLAIFLFDSQKAYSYQRFTSYRTELQIVFRVMSYLLLLGIGIVYLLGFKSYPRTFFVIWYPVSIAIFSLQKLAMFWFAYRSRERGKDRKRVMLVGTGTRATQFMQMARKHFGWGLDVVGTVTGDAEKVGKDFQGIPIVGTYRDIERLLREINPEEVIITVSTKRFNELRDVLEACEREGVQVRLNSDFFGQITKGVRLDNVYGLTIISFDMTRQSEFALFIKRIIDIVGALTALTIFSPFMILAAIGIYLSDGWPVLYDWNVIGLNKKPFRSWKFRTMVRNADSLKEQLMEKNEMDGPVFKIKEDPRILPFGRWLRKWSIDETPQLFSVLRGDMSLVGPRPAAPNELDKYESWHRRKLSVKPGLTCLWQASGRNTISKFDDWVKMDLEYIDNWSLLLDFKILFKTIPAVLSRKGAS